MPKEDTQFTSETGSAAGKKGKRKPHDQQMREWLQSELEDHPGTTVEDAMRKALLRYGLKGNVMAIREAMNRAYGQAKQHTELSGSIDIPGAQIVINGKVE